MFKSKHSGWTWDLKRTPFGGGGSFNPVSAITNTISSALGTDGGGGGLLGAAASIDPGPAIGSGLAELDKGVNQIPGGWYTVGGLAAGGTALAFAPEIAALAGVDAGTTIGSEIGQQAFFDSLASGASSTEAINAGLAADLVATTGGAAANTLNTLPGSTSTIPSAGGSLTSSTGIGINAPSLTTGLELGSAPPIGATGSAGLTGGLSQGTVLGNGLNGGQIGVSYVEAVPGSGQIATNALGNPITAGANGFGIEGAGTASSANTISNTDLANLLKSSATSGANTALQKLAASQNPSSLGLLNVLRNNQSPFTQSQSMQVSPQKSELSTLINLLKKG